MTRKPPLPLVLLVIMAFLTPIIGGLVSQDALSLEPGFLALLRSVFSGAFGQGLETPLLSHFVLAGLASAALIATVIRRKILQLPWAPISGALLLFLGFLLASVALSSFRWTTMAALAEWLSYGIAFFAVVSSVGRERGAVAVLSALFASCVLLSIWGLMLEYPSGKLGDPGYRLFLGWVNPNAAAGMMSIGLLIGFGLLSTREGLEKLLSGVGCVAVGAALILTLSKGAVLATIVGGLVFAILALAWTGFRKPSFAKVGLAGACVVLAVLASYGIQKSQQHQKDAAAFGRLGQASDTREQSEGFRKLLYQGARKIIQENPVGYGLGTYRYESARSGLTTPTVLTHNTYYQLAVETGLSFATPLTVAGYPLIVSLTGLLLLGFLGLWVYQSFRGARSLPDSQNILRAAVVAAVVSVCAHGMVESNLYYYGIGLSCFVLMGIGLLLSADAVAPEFTPKAGRAGIGMAALGVALQLVYSGWVEAQRAQVRGLIDAGDVHTAAAAADSLVAIAPTDGDSWALRAYLSRSPLDQLRAAENAVTYAPTSKNLRALARAYQRNQQPGKARDALNRALRRDANNVETLGLAFDFEKELGDTEAIDKVARRLLAVEGTEYYKVRSLAELVPTKTAEARVYLASRAKDPKEVAGLLQGALDIYLEYAAKTVPNIKRFAAEKLDYGGESLEDARDKLAAGQEVAQHLAVIYRSMGASDLVRVAETSGSKLAEVAGGLGAPNK